MDKKNIKTVAEEIVERSGNSFHSRVVKLLREDGWSVLVSPYYSDNFTDKPREIDIIAEKLYPVKDRFNIIGYINARLFVECKYVAHDTVFWFDEKDTERSIKRTMEDTGLGHPDRYSYTQNHHYLVKEKVAKLFASNANKNEDNEVVSKAINQNLNALVYYRDRGDLKLTTTPQGYVENILKYVSYPLIVVNSFEKFHQTPMAGENNPQLVTAPFQLEVNYAYKDKESRNEYFLIDVVSLDTLKTFLAGQIEKADLSAISQHLAAEERMSRSQNQHEDSASG